MISSFLGLQTSLRGLLAQQQALDVAAHNVANANTVGYTRQEATLGAANPLHLPAGATQSGAGAFLGQGVDVTAYRRLRDSFLDLQVRAQSMSLGDATTSAEALDRVQSAVGEPSDHRHQRPDGQVLHRVERPREPPRVRQLQAGRRLRRPDAGRRLRQARRRPHERRQRRQRRVHQHPWDADRYLATGETLPAGALDDFRDNYAAVFIGAFGDPRVPDMKHAADILLGIRFGLDLYVNFRPGQALRRAPLPAQGQDARRTSTWSSSARTPRAPTSASAASSRRGRPTRSPCRRRSTPARAWSGSSAPPSSTRSRTAAEKVCMADKSNVMRYGHDLWQRTFAEVAAEFPEIEAAPHVRRRADHADGARAGELRRHRHQQHVRRHHHRPRRRVPGRARAWPPRQHPPRTDLDVRAGSRLGPEVRRHRPRQPLGRRPLRGADARRPWATPKRRPGARRGGVAPLLREGQTTPTSAAR